MSYSIVLIFVILFIIIIVFMVLLAIVMVRNSKKRSTNYISNNTVHNPNNPYGRMNMSVDTGKPSSITSEKCKACGYSNSSSWSFCPNCGSKKENESHLRETKKCVNCGKEFTLDRFFCDTCGGKLE